MSQAALADALDVSRQTVNALENGRYDPSLPLAFRIAHLFGLKIEDIFEPGPSGAGSTGDPRGSTTPSNSVILSPAADEP